MNRLPNGTIAVGSPGSPARLAAELEDAKLNDGIDRIPRYAPTRVSILAADNRVMHTNVTKSVYHPANTHPKSPIKDEMGALELVTAYGSRWYGCENAYINSELKMIVVGFDKRDEVRNKWEICTKE